MAEITNRMIATKKMILAISTANPAMPPKPSTAAIKATIRNVRAPPSMAMILTCKRPLAPPPDKRPDPANVPAVPRRERLSGCGIDEMIFATRMKSPRTTMATKRSRASVAPNATMRTADGTHRAKGSLASPPASSSAGKSRQDTGQRSTGWHQLFSNMACGAAHYAGHPLAFLTAAVLVIAWAVTGPLFGFSDTWQLVINTSTTIVTFLMVFLIQHTQNRDTLSVQLKIAELIIAAKGA